MLRYETRGLVAYLTIDNPAQLNALTLADNDRMGELLRAFRDDDERLVLIITGAGDRAFCTRSAARLGRRKQDRHGVTPRLVVRVEGSYAIAGGLKQVPCAPHIELGGGASASAPAALTRRAKHRQIGTIPAPLPEPRPP